ncbi:7-deoxyloganetin glucosyltransferase-like isoform X2 [Chenopodium quinoa]|uniref:7-deoxyloganetin glucosyltransferase-like isoform X2 n=1 Tax=Chenopodium quinoa TaxID=63459 RepID=UPI000B76C80F|nr:7-deoxyloganetin glucosyltransferase-like isoform X2 [Chenopodium quinoa]
MMKHAVCIPFPSKSHIFPMLKFAQILHFKYGFHITFLNTHYFHQTLFQSTSQNDTFSSKGNSKITFKFESILNDSNDLTSGVNSVIDETLAPLLKEVLVKLGSKDNYSKSLSCDDDPPLPPTVSCMVYDVAVSKITLDVAEEMGIPAVGLDVISACGILGYLQDRQLLDKEIIPLKDSSCLTNGYLETTIDWIPSLKGIRLKNLPTTFRATNPNDRCLNYVSSYLKKALESKAIILNTFDALEKDVLEDLSSFSPNIYAVGPFDLLLDKIIKDVDENDHIHRPNTEEDNCDYMQWLDSQEPNSVLYISFGTVVQLTEEQFDELAWGLANSQAKFFWIVRPDQVSGRSNTLPLGYEDEVKHRGIFATWCDQKKVLAHPSIGGFVTQRGWNSALV